MDLFDAARVSVRRWYVLVPLLVLTALAATSVYRSAATVWTSSASVGIAPPSTTTVDPTVAGQPRVSRSNTLLESGGTTLLANLLAIGLGAPDVGAQLREQGAAGSYDATVLTRSGSQQLPVVSLTVTASSPAAAQQTLSLLAAQSRTTLTGIQVDAGVPDDLQATTYSVQPAYYPVADSPGRTRAAGAAAVAGLALSLVLTVLLDGLLARRSRRAAAQPG